MGNLKKIKKIYHYFEEVHLIKEFELTETEFESIIMIRKVPNMSAWVMRTKDYAKWNLISKWHLGFQTIRELPLFDINPIATMYWTIEENELILVIDSYVHPTPYTLEEIEEINKTWNKFYES